MQITDAIADMLTRIRNAGTAGHPTVMVPASNLKKAIAQILVDEGYITSFETIEDDKQGCGQREPPEGTRWSRYRYHLYVQGRYD